MLGGGALPPRTPCWPPEILRPAEDVKMLGGGGLPPRTPPAGRPPAGGVPQAEEAEEAEEAEVVKEKIEKRVFISFIIRKKE